jgi:rRNA maturation endonuclease Nob1
MCYTDFKRCKKCGRIFDIATNFDVCPECRIKMKGGDENERKK